LNVGHTFSLSIAKIKADNSSAIGNCNSGKMQLPVKFKTAPLGNNYDRYGKSLKAIAKSTKHSITTSITLFWTKFGQNAGIFFGTSQSQPNLVMTSHIEFLVL
jgi:hypothetical protein